jgi:energy-coupling factor transporter ATP-binding protein EcfA2
MHTERAAVLEMLSSYRFCDQDLEPIGRKKPDQPSSSLLSELSTVPLEHKQMKAIMGKMAYLQRKGSEQCEARALMLTGQSGSGKTTLIEHYKKFNPPIKTQDRIITPVVSAVTPAKPTVIDLAETILIALGDVDPRLGKKEEKTERILYLLKACGVELLILDEFQHFYDHGGKATLEVTNWLKNLITLSKVPMVLAGLPRCGYILQKNSQMGRRFAYQHYLSPFNARSPKSFAEYRGVLQELQRRIPGECIALHEPSLALRMLMATEGLIGRTISLLDAATDFAHAQSCDIDESVLAFAFREVIWQRAPDGRNPFYITDQQVQPLRKADEPYADWDTSFGAGETAWQLH